MYRQWGDGRGESPAKGTGSRRRSAWALWQVAMTGVETSPSVGEAGSDRGFGEGRKRRPIPDPPPLAGPVAGLSIESSGWRDERNANKCTEIFVRIYNTWQVCMVLWCTRHLFLLLTPLLSTSSATLCRCGQAGGLWKGGEATNLAATACTQTRVVSLARRRPHSTPFRN